MSFHGQAVGHIVRRGVSAAQEHFSGVNAEYMQALQQEAELYDNAGPEMEVNPWEMLPVLITGIIALFVIASIRYSLGDVVASLTMIESHSTNVMIITDKPPAYADEPDAPLEKESLMPSEAEADLTHLDIETFTLNNRPLVTRSIRSAMAHLKSVGGWTARWRGARMSALYHVAHSFMTNALSQLLGFGLFGNALVYVFTSVALCRLHMAWTHSMVATSNPKPFWRRMVPRQKSGAVVLPALVFALAQQATWVLPVAVAYALGLHNIEQDHIVQAAHHKDCAKLGLMGLRFLAVPATAIFVAFAVLLPATVTLTRIEAMLLPADQQHIVPFDCKTMIEGVNLEAKGANKAIFVQAWRSFDSAARWRLIKLYVKMAFIQIGVAFIALHVMVAEIFIVGGERLGLLFRSAAAQMQLAAIEAQQAGN